MNGREGDTGRAEHRKTKRREINGQDNSYYNYFTKRFKLISLFKM